MTEKTFSIVILINTKSEYDVERFNKVLAPSLKFVNCPKVLIIPRLCEELQLDDTYTVLIDHNVVNTPTRCSGYFKQCLLKLYISRQIKTTHYLLLDSDIYVNRKFEFSEFFNDDDEIILFVYDGSQHLDKSQYYTSCHVKWLYDSLTYLNKDPKTVLWKFHYGVTPALMITSEVNELLDTIERDHSTFVKDFVGGNIGTEYTHYYLHVNGKHLYSEDLTKTFCSGLWNLNEPESQLRKNDTFWIIQSNLKMNNAEVLKFVRDNGSNPI